MNIRTAFRALGGFLQKNYLFKNDKYRYAISLPAKYIPSPNYSLSEYMICKAYAFFNNPYKFKRIIQALSSFLHRNKKNYHRLLTVFHVGTILSLATAIYLLLLKSFEYFKKLDEFCETLLIIHYQINKHNNYPIRKSEEVLRELTSKHVFYSEKVNIVTAKLIADVCRKPNIEAFIGKSLRNLLEKEVIIEGTKNISLGALHRNLLREEFLYEKFKNLVFAQMRKENVRKELLTITENFIKSEYAYNVYKSQFAAALRNPGVVETFVDGCRNKAFSVMDNDDYKALASQKLRNIDFF